jgi:hypothetical protein
LGAAEDNPQIELRRLVDGYQVSQSLHVAATLKLADLLADGPRTGDELAAATEAHADALYRLLRALAAVGVFKELDDGRFELTPLGEGLRTDAPASIHGWAAFIGRPYIWNTWSALVHSIGTGENTFRHVHGTDVWTFRSERPEEAAIFDAAMTSVTGQQDAAILRAYDFGRFGEIVDIAGGRGRLLRSILAKHPSVRGVLFDLPHVIAQAGDLLEPVADRCRLVGGSFFESVPEGADAYLLKSIIHDWEDEESIAILRTVRAAMPEHGVVLVIERDLGAPNENAPAKLSDLIMLVGPGGRERTEDEYAALFAAAGFTYARATPTTAGMSLFEARVHT